MSNNVTEQSSKPRKTNIWLWILPAIALVLALAFIIWKSNHASVSMDAFAPTGIENGHEWVDMGFGVKWATCNIGASRPEEYGDYFAWGETKTKEQFTISNYKYYAGFYVSGNLPHEKLSAYVLDSDYGTVDNIVCLEQSDDAAQMNWGGNWRLPTPGNFADLIEQCKWTWTKMNGISGFKVTSTINGNSIFFPAAGFHDKTMNDGITGFYWTDSLYYSHSMHAWLLCFDKFGPDLVHYYRSNGATIRPVME